MTHGWQFGGLIARRPESGPRTRRRMITLLVAALATLLVAMATPAFAAGDFQVAVQPNLQPLTVGGSTTFTVQVGRIGGFAAPVTLAATHLPPGITATFSANPVTPPAKVTLTIHAGPDATPIGPVALLITGTSGGVTHLATYSATLNLALDPTPVVPPCVVTVEGTVRDAETNAVIVGATVNGVLTNSSGQYHYVQSTAGGVPSALANVSARLDPDYWYSQTATNVIACGTTKTGVDLTLLRKKYFDISGTVYQGVVPDNTEWWNVVATSTPVAQADVLTWTRCGYFDSDVQERLTDAAGHYPPTTFPLGYDNTPIGVSARAGKTENACTTPPFDRVLGQYWWSPIQSQVASAPDHQHLTQDFAIVPKCAGSVKGTVVYGDTNLPAPGVSLNAVTTGSLSPYDGWDSAANAGTNVVSDASGNFTFPSGSLRLWYNNQPTSYTIDSSNVPSPRQDWGGGAEIRLSGCGDQPTATVVLHAPPPVVPPGAIEGHLTDEETHGPVAGRSVCINFTYLCAVTDAAGYYKIPNISVLSVSDPTAVSIVAIPPPTIDTAYWSSYPQTLPTALVTSGLTTSGIDLQVLHKRWGAIEGIVRDPTTGSAVPTAVVQVPVNVCPAADPCTTTYDGLGGFRIDHVQLGYRNAGVTTTVKAFANGYVARTGVATATYTVSVSADTTTPLDPQLEKLVLCQTTATISGRITDASTALPLGNALVRFPGVPGLGGTERFATTDAKGNYVIDGVPVSTSHPQQATLTVSKTGYFTRAGTVTLACGGIVDIGGSPRPTVKVNGTPMCADNHTAVRVELVVQPKAGTTVLSVTDPYLRVTNIDQAPNSWSIHLKSAGPSIPAHRATVIVNASGKAQTLDAAIPRFTCR